MKSLVRKKKVLFQGIYTLLAANSHFIMVTFDIFVCFGSISSVDSAGCKKINILSAISANSVRQEQCYSLTPCLIAHRALEIKNNKFIVGIFIGCCNVIQNSLSKQILPQFGKRSVRFTICNLDTRFWCYITLLPCILLQNFCI